MNSEILDFTIVTCLEGGSNHWIDHVSSTSLPITLTDIEGDKHVLDTDDFHQGWVLLNTLYPQAAERIAELDGQADAEDTDTLLQLVTYGELVYG